MTKKIEDKYKELSEVQHVLLRPGMWVGSIKEEEKDMYIYDRDTETMRLKTVNYIPAMLKVVDEVISNSCDEFRRTDNMGLTELKIEISGDTIKIRDDGGIPVQMHKVAGCYVPEFIFGRLRTSSNYDDTEDRNVIGTNGVGSALTNVFSKYFEIETADGKNKFHRSWSNNMQTLNDDLKIEKCDKHFTQTAFKLDFSRFECSTKSFTQDFIDVLMKRAIDAAAANPGLKVVFIDNVNKNKQKYVYKFKNLDKYIEMYTDIDLDTKIAFKNDLCVAYVFPGSTNDIGFVNGAECSKGTHMRALRTEINNAVCEFISKKDKIKDLTARGIDGKYSIFMSINVSNPSYDSQTKECLTTPVESFSKNNNIGWQVDDKFIRKILKSEIIELVRDWYKKKIAAEDQRELRKLNRQTCKALKRPDKYISCSSRKAKDRQLWIFEGDSAKAGFRSGRNPDTQAGYTMRGVPLNCYDMQPLQIMKNEVFNDLVNIIGLKWGEEFNKEDLNFSKIVIASDADVDGDKIASLLLVFANNWPELFEQNIICRSMSPIIIARKGKDCKKYYSMKQYKADEKSLKGYTLKYTKGLGGLNAAESHEMYQTPNFLYFNKDNDADSYIDQWFNKSDSEPRKKLLSA